MPREQHSTDAAYSDAELILAARLYHIDGLSQSQVAKVVGASQAKISRMLALARERGIVRITVPEYNPRDEKLEQAIRDRFQLADALVIRRLANQTVVDLRIALGYFAAPIASQWVTSSAKVAIAGGRTLRCLVDRMRPAGTANPVEFAQVMGNIDEVPGGYDALEIGRILAQRWGGTFYTLNTPALLPDPDICKQFLALDQVRKVFLQLSKADLALVGIGNLYNSVFLERCVLKPRDLDLLKSAGAVGEIVGRFYDANGKECDTPLRHRVISLGLDRLRRVRRVVGVVAGDDRTEAMLGAVRGKIVTSLVIDDAAAQRLMAAAEPAAK